MNNNFLIKQNTALNELQFMIAGKLYGQDVQEMFDVLMRSGIDEKCIGFWVLDLRKKRAILHETYMINIKYPLYSAESTVKFRKVHEQSL